MKTRISAGLVALAVLLMAFAAVASAASANTSRGKLTKFTYNVEKKVGTLKVTSQGNTKIFKLNGKTDCGVSYGQSGDQIPCKTLRRDKYQGKPVRVIWERVEGVRVASQVAADQSQG